MKCTVLAIICSVTISILHAQKFQPGYTVRLFYIPVNRPTVLLNGGDEKQDVNKNMELWVLKNTGWSKINVKEGPPVRNGYAAALDEGSGSIYLYGGQINVRGVDISFNDLWKWDGRKWTDLSKEHNPGKLVYSLMVFDKTRSALLLFGGLSDKGESDDIWMYKNHKWAKLIPDQKPSRRLPGAFWFDDVSNRIFLYGGLTFENKDRADLNDLWSFKDNKWTLEMPVSSTNFTVIHPTMTTNKKGQLILFGGSLVDAGQALQTARFTNKAWFFSKGVWRAYHMGQGPSLSGHAIAYDFNRNRYIVAGGFSKPAAKPERSTWIYENSLWTEYHY